MSHLLGLRNQVKDLIVDLPATVTAYVDDLIREAVKDLQIRHNYRVMRASHSTTTVFGSHSAGTLPGNWKEPRRNPWFITFAGDEKEIDWVGQEEDELFRLYATTDPTSKGSPRHLFARSSDETGTLQLEVYPYPDGLSDWTASPAGEYRLYIPYYKFLNNLELDADTNWFTANATRFIVEQAAGHGFLKNWDEQRAAVHFQAATVYERVIRRQDAALAGPPERAVAVRADAHGTRRSLGMRW
jgi:hypothetical protein